MRRIFISFFIIFAFLSGGSIASDIYPNIPKASGKPHPEGNEYMRINHMDMLKHDRDITMHEGIRNTDNGLAQCISCHVVKGEDNKPVTIKSEKHFCSTCHQFAAVKIDCFSCHNSVPQENAKNSSLFENSNHSYDILLSYLLEGAQ